MTDFDAIVVGAGQAGSPLAARLTAAGMKVALVERKLLGGTCVNTGCTPTKALVASARAAHVARHAERWGVFHDGAVRVDMAKVAARARKVSEDARAGLARWLGAMAGRDGGPDPDRGSRPPGRPRRRAGGRRAAARAPQLPGRWRAGRGAAVTPPTTTSRSSPPTCSTAPTAAWARACRATPSYIDPPLGRCGMTEAQARASGRPLLVAKRAMARVGRAVEKGETDGFMKVVADAETRRILGAAILGVEGDEAIHGILDAMHADLPYPVLRWAVPIHPTVSELIPTLLDGLAPSGRSGPGRRVSCAHRIRSAPTPPPAGRRAAALELDLPVGADDADLCDGGRPRRRSGCSVIARRGAAPGRGPGCIAGGCRSSAPPRR
jgi:hypothetical protein